MNTVAKTDPRYSKCRPLISYYGGKQRMAAKIVPLLPEHTVYVEPFAGGAAVLFAKPWPDIKSKSQYREVLNDSYSDLNNLYTVAREMPDALTNLIKSTPYGREVFKMARMTLKTATSSRLQRAWAYYVKINQSFASTGQGWGTAVSSSNQAGAWADRQYSSAMRRLKEVHIEHDDAVAVIKRWDSPQTLFYCDPPYVGTEMKHYTGYSNQKFSELIQCLNSCKGAFVLSCYQNVSSKLVGAIDAFIYNTNCSSSGAGKVRKMRNTLQKASVISLGDCRRAERIYRRFNTVPWRPELEKLRQAGKYRCFARNPAETSSQGRLL